MPILRERTYIECGRPCWGAVPYFSRRFCGRVAIVYLTRHPIPTACSWVTHGLYRPPVIAGLHPEKVPVSPLDAGVALPEYGDIWDTLDPFQRSLYIWAEVKRFGLSCEATLGIPWLRLRYEDMLSPAALARLLDFLGLPSRAGVFDAAETVEDRFRSITDIWWDVSSATRPPALSALAPVFGYDVADVDEVALRHRYLAW